MKRYRLIFILFLLLTGILTFVSSQASTTLTDATDDLTAGVDKVNSKWDYLGAEWKTILLKNPIVVKVDAFFKTISSVFVVLFAMPYSMSLTLLGIVIIWILFWNMIYNGVSASGIIGKGSSLVLSLLTVIALAQLGVLSAIIVFFGRLVFSKEGTLSRIIIMALIAMAVIVLHYISNVLSKYTKAKKEKDEKNLEKFNRTYLMRFVNSFKEFSNMGK